MDLNITTINAAKRTAYIALLKNTAKAKYASTTIPVAKEELTEYMSKITDLAVRKGFINNTAYDTVTAYVDALYTEATGQPSKDLASQIIDDVDAISVTVSNPEDQALLTKINTLTQELGELRSEFIEKFTAPATVAMEQFNTLISEA